VTNFTGTSRFQAWNLGRDLSTHLHYYLAQFVLPQAWSDFSWIAVARGPGSFTGTRIGMVTARTVAQQLNVPLFAISTLAVVAWVFLEAKIPSNQTIAVEMLAQAGEVFGGIYQITPARQNLIPLLPDKAFPMQDWQQVLANWPTPYQHVQGNQVDAKLACGAVLGLANQCWQKGDRPHWSEALPFYG